MSAFLSQTNFSFFSWAASNSVWYQCVCTLYAKPLNRFAALNNVATWFNTIYSFITLLIHQRRKKTFFSLHFQTTSTMLQCILIADHFSSNQKLYRIHWYPWCVFISSLFSSSTASRQRVIRCVDTFRHQVMWHEEKNSINNNNINKKETAKWFFFSFCCCSIGGVECDHSLWFIEQKKALYWMEEN